MKGARFTVLTLAMLLTGLGAVYSESSGAPISSSQVSQVTPITIPDPFPLYPALAGQSGFFWTRSATESGVLAMETVPILKNQILQLENNGTQQAKKLDDKDAIIQRQGFIIIGALIIGGIFGALIGG